MKKKVKEEPNYIKMKMENKRVGAPLVTKSK